ncbi:MAG: PfkB family carbohydrate kinase [Ilumatobacteraceae bacterium]
MSVVIVVAGEALIDLVVTPDGVTATAGGAPYNVARACGRLGAAPALAACLSEDGFGRTLRAGLAECGVRDDLLQFTDRPTTLAVAQVDGDGVATYHFYTEGTSAPQLTPGSVPEHALALVTGGLALVLEPMARDIERLVTEAGAGVLVVVDINARPGAVADRDLYVERVRNVTARADVVKASHEDLEYLFPDEGAHDAACHLLDGGAKAVLVTSGPSDTTICTAAGSVAVPVVAVEVVDSIGAGDAFTAGFTTHWLQSGGSLGELSEPPALLPSVQAAHAVAAVVVGRRGADPPTPADVDWPD